MGFSLFGPSLFLKKYLMELTHKEIILKAVGNFEWPDLVLSDGNQGETPLRQCADLLSLVKVLESVRVISSFAPLEGSSGFLVKHGTCKCKRKAGVISDETAEQEQPRGVLVTVIQASSFRTSGRTKHIERSSRQQARTMCEAPFTSRNGQLRSYAHWCVQKPKKDLRRNQSFYQCQVHLFQELGYFIIKI